MKKFLYFSDCAVDVESIRFVDDISDTDSEGYQTKILYNVGSENRSIITTRSFVTIMKEIEEIIHSKRKKK